MLFRRKPLADLHDRGPLRVMFVITSMPVGGAETLLVELIRRLDRSRFLPELCCLKDLGPLGETLAVGGPRASRPLGPQDRRGRAVAFGGADAAAADRRGRHRRRRRQDVLGAAGGPPGRRAGDRFGPAFHRLARPRAICQSPAGPDHRRLHRRGRTAWPLPGGTRGLHGVEDPRDPQRRRRGAVPSAAAQRRRCGRSSAWLPTPPSSASWPRSARKRTMPCFCGLPQRVQRAVPAARFLIVGDGPQRGELEALAESLSHLRRRPLPGHAERRARGAFPDRRAGPQLAHRGQSGIDPGSDGRRKAGRGHAGRLGR